MPANAPLSNTKHEILRETHGWETEEGHIRLGCEMSQLNLTRIVATPLGFKHKTTRERIPFFLALKHCILCAVCPVFQIMRDQEAQCSGSFLNVFGRPQTCHVFGIVINSVLWTLAF